MSFELIEYFLYSCHRIERCCVFERDASYMWQARVYISKVQWVRHVINDLRKKDLLSVQAAENISASFSGPALELVTRCLQKKSGSSVQPYPTQLKSFALTLQFYSARAYDYVRTVFVNCLPHPRTLSTWYQCVNGNPGFSDDVFAALQVRARSSDTETL